MGEFVHMCAMQSWREIFIVPSPTLTWRQVQFLDLQSTLFSSYRYQPGVRPHERDCSPVINPTCNVQNGLFHFCEPCVKSKWWLQLVPPCPSSHELRGQTETIFSIGRVNDARCFPSWFFTTKPKVYLFPLSSKSLLQYLQTWCQLLLLSVSPIGSRLTHRLVFIERSICDVPPPQIRFNPSGLGYHCIHSELRRLFWGGWLSHHVSYCDVQWQDFRFCSWACYTQKRSIGNRRIYFRGYGD